MITIEIKGPQGCGKSTLAKKISKFLLEEQGFNVLILDEESEFKEFKRQPYQKLPNILIKTTQI